MGRGVPAQQVAKLLTGVAFGLGRGVVQTGQVHDDVIREGGAQQGGIIGRQVRALGQNQALQGRGARRGVDEPAKVGDVRRRQGLLEKAALLIAAARLKA
ncbi:hypothetical protein D3C87_1477580 [compost metagenome]